MPSRRVDVTMNDVEVFAALEAARTAVLVTLGPEGDPEPVGMWFVLEGDAAAPVVAMRTYAASQKAVNLRRDPRAALLVESGERYLELRGVRLSGRVDLDHDPERIADIWTGLAMKYERLEPAHVEAFRSAARGRAHKQVALVLRPTSVVSWDHRKLADER